MVIYSRRQLPQPDHDQKPIRNCEIQLSRQGARNSVVGAKMMMHDNVGSDTYNIHDDVINEADSHHDFVDDDDDDDDDDNDDDDNDDDDDDDDEHEPEH